MKKSTVLPVHFALAHFTPWILVAIGLAFGAVGLSSLVTSAMADEGERAQTSCSSAIWPQVKMLAQECLENRDSGEKCDSFTFSGARSASFEISGVEYTAEIQDSELSDGGDLNDVFVQRQDGCKFELRNIPAFGDLLQALASVQSR